MTVKRRIAMRYCPKCRAEYQDRVEKCLDCGVNLVDTKPETMPESTEQVKIITKGKRSYFKQPLVPVGSFENNIEAQFSKGILESEGIDSIIANPDVLIAYQPDASSSSNIALLVRESEAEKAREILNSIDKNISEDDFLEGDVPEEGMAETEPD
jgi:hypothetical protein